MTDTEIIAELGRTYKDRAALSDLQTLTGMYLDELIPIVCDTKEFKRHERYHSRPNPIINAPQYKLSRIEAIRDDAVRLYNAGMCHREVAAELGVCQTVVQVAIAGAREAGAEVREYFGKGKAVIG